MTWHPTGGGPGPRQNSSLSRGLSFSEINMACCPCAMMCCGLGLVPLAESALSTPKGRATSLALAPFLLLACALAAGYTEMAELTKMAECVGSCQCARGYAVGAVALWVLGIQYLLKSGEAPTLPKGETAATSPPVELDSKGKVAAKAA